MSISCANYRIIPLLLLALFFIACKQQKREAEGGILVRIGNSTLTVDELSRQLPAGFDAADSIRLSRAYIRSWIDSKLIEEIAAKNIGDMSDIDRMVNDYRNELIAYEYQRRMADRRVATTFSDDSLKIYYDQNSERFVIERPLIKGIFVKLPVGSPIINSLKKWMVSKNLSDIDKLEKEGRDAAIQYDYFRDRWIDWEQIELKIPFDFGNDANGFVRTHGFFECESDGVVYLLSISDFITKGSVMPFDFAKELIIQDMTYRRRAEFNNEMSRELLRDAESSGELEIFCDLDS